MLFRSVGAFVIKFFADKRVCEQRVKRTYYLQPCVPEIVDWNPHFYKYKYVKGRLFADCVNRNNFQDLLQWSFGRLWGSLLETNEGSGDLDGKAFDFYKQKTIGRLNDFLISSGVEDKLTIINDEVVPSAKDMLNKINFIWLSDMKPSRFHGDFILDNIIQTDNGFKLIDWRQDFCGNLEVGDIYYDFAKLAHNLVINHGIIDGGHYGVEKKNDTIKLTLHRLQNLVDCEQIFFSYLGNKGFDVGKVKLLRAIIWLNMSPLHHNPFNIFLYYYSRYTMKRLLYDEV